MRRKTIAEENNYDSNSVDDRGSGGDDDGHH